MWLQRLSAKQAASPYAIRFLARHGHLVRIFDFCDDPWTQTGEAARTFSILPLMPNVDEFHLSLENAAAAFGDD